MLRPRLALLLAPLLLLLATAASARVTFTPIQPTSGDRVRVTISGMWRDGCVPTNPQVAISGREIAITLSTPQGVGCTLAIRPFEETVAFGPLQPGVYDLVVRILDGTAGATQPIEFERRELVVRQEDAPFTLRPASSPARNVLPQEGGFVVEIAPVPGAPSLVTCTASGCVAPRVFFGDVPSPEVTMTGDSLRVRVPAHAAGVVDVTVGQGTGALRAQSAFRFYDPAAAPSGQSFTPILVPLLFSGPGALGSQWVTNVRVRNSGPVPVLFAGTRGFNPCVIILPVPGTTQQCGPLVGENSTIFVSNENRARGVVLWTPREQANDLSFSAIIRDTSRADISHGAELPIVREDDFRESIEFPSLPLDDPRYRVMLRVYALETSLDTIWADVYDASRGTPTSRAMTLTRQAADEPAYGELMLTRTTREALLRLRGNYSLHPFWAFVTITNNETQQVTIVRPQ